MKISIIGNQENKSNIIPEGAKIVKEYLRREEEREMREKR